MGANRTPIDSSMTIQKAISQGGYYNTDGDWNNIVTLDEYPGKLLRGRVEVLILKDGKLFMYMKENGNYRIPGGGFDKGVLNKDQAFIETKEEAKLIIENIRYTGVTYTHLFEDVWESKDKKEVPYHGNYNEVYIATYKGDYHGYIRKGLSDMELTNKGKFYELSEVEDILKEPHKQALINMLNGVVTENTTDDDLILTAKQIQNTLRNLHNKMDSYHCLRNRDIESDNGGWIFAEYYTESPSDVDEVKRFIKYCNAMIQSTIYRGYVEEPLSYKHGFLFIRNEDQQYESTYLIDESCVDFFNEASAKIKEGKYPVFIVNSHIGTTFGKLITTWTQSKYAHSSISLDTSLENLYSFNREGFVKESLTAFKEFNANAPIQVSCIFVKKDDIKVIKERLDWLWSNKDKTKYALDNIVNIMFNKPMETAKDSLTMVCSQFVTWVLSFADIKLMDKSLNLITPKDLANLHNPKVYKLYEGTVKDYDKKKIDRIFRKLKDKSQLIKNDYDYIL